MNVRLLPLLIFALILSVGCKQDASSSAQPKKQETIQKPQGPKITATKDGLARIIMRQTRLVDESDPANTETKEYMVSVLSDGSNFRVICEWPKSSNNGWAAVTKDLQYVVYVHNYAKGKQPHPQIKENIIIQNLKDGSKKYLFTEKDLDIDNETGMPMELWVARGRLNPYTNKAILHTASSCRIIDIPSGRYKNIAGYKFLNPVLLPSGKIFSTWYKMVDEEYQGQLPILYDVQDKKFEYIKQVPRGLIMNKFKTSADRSLISYSIRGQMNSKDTVLFFDGHLNPLPGLSGKKLATQFHIGPKGEWLYYHLYAKSVENLAIFRIKKSRLFSIPSPNESFIKENGELVYVNPEVNNMDYNTDITQILPAK